MNKLETNRSTKKTKVQDKLNLKSLVQTTMLDLDDRIQVCLVGGAGDRWLSVVCPSSCREDAIAVLAAFSIFDTLQHHQQDGEWTVLLA